jgi:hypothetical protein
MKTFKDLEEEISSSISWLAQWKEAPEQLAALRYVISGHPEVWFEYSMNSAKKEGRKVRKDKAAKFFDREEVSLVISNLPQRSATESRTEAPNERTAVSPAAVSPTASQVGVQSVALDQLVEALADAEQRLDFVSLKWFRDTCLAEKPWLWTRNFEDRKATLQQALDSKLVLTHSVFNPKNPDWDVTAIRLNRSHPQIAKSKTRPAEQKRFHPTRISGSPLSRTVIEGRR